ncbi:hypothetical protein GCM10025792_24270 [Pseudonocardia tropica]|uniref:hypothetical protein n=1 Tax=Pseudonocardia tropica TaxID=681289 RepID=UPI0031E9D944
MPYDRGVIRNILIAQLQVIPTLVVAFLLIDRKRRHGRTRPEWERERDRLEARKAYAVRLLSQEHPRSGTLSSNFKATLSLCQPDHPLAIMRV